MGSTRMRDWLRWSMTKRGRRKVRLAGVHRLGDVPVWFPSAPSGRYVRPIEPVGGEWSVLRGKEAGGETTPCGVAARSWPWSRAIPLDALAPWAWPSCARDFAALTVKANASSDE